MKANPIPESVVIAGYYGFGNAGDELILYALLQRFRRNNPAIGITVLSNSPAHTKTNFDVQSVNRWRPWQWISPLFKAQRFVLGGGGLLQESTSRWNHLYYLSLVLIAKLFGCRTEILSLGVDPIHGLFNRFWTRFVLNHAIDHLSVRDELSVQALRSAGVTFPIALERDPVLEIEPRLPHTPASGIAFALSPSRHRPQWSQDIADLSDRLSRELSVPIDLLVLFPDQDSFFSHEVADRTRAIRNVRICLNAAELLSWIPHYQVVAGSRFHALVLAAKSKIPFVGWGVQPKVASLCRAYGMVYSNTDEKWDLNEQFERLASLYQSRNKSVILETRTA